MTWVMFVGTTYTYFSYIWHIKDDPGTNGYAVVKSKKDSKYYITPKNITTDSQDEGPYDTLEIAKTILRMRR